MHHQPREVRLQINNLKTDAECRIYTKLRLGTKIDSKRPTKLIIMHTNSSGNKSSSTNSLCESFSFDNCAASACKSMERKFT